MTAESAAAAAASPPAAGVAPTIEVRNVSRWFGNVVPVSDVSFEIGPGVTGLLGPNGAGKTTLLRMISGLARASEGEIRVLGEPVRGNPEIYRRVGVMPEHEGVYRFQTGRAFVRLNARLHGLDDVDGAVQRAIGIVDMAAAADRSIGGYSRGMRQRMRLASALVHDPPVLLLDEPLSGADPRQRIELQAVIRRFAEEGRTIVVSSHILEEVEAIADRVLVLVAGKLAASGDFRAIRRLLNERPYRVRVDASVPRHLAASLLLEPAVASVSVEEDGSLRVLSRDVDALQRAIPLAAQRAGARLTRVDPLDDTLESVFDYLAER
jgi:ABC-2 type transport system ATP-binding protein